MDQKKLLKNFGRCHDWEEKYLYLIELGERYATLPELEQLPQYTVTGCQSQVWIKVTLVDGKVQLNGNSDAAIVKGLVAMLLILLQQMSPSELIAFDIHGVLDQLDLKQQITPTRNQGMAAMLTAIYRQVNSSCRL